MAAPGNATTLEFCQLLPCALLHPMRLYNGKRKILTAKKDAIARYLFRAFAITFA